MSSTENGTPELIRVSEAWLHDDHRLHFDFAAANEILKQKPEQVVHVTEKIAGSSLLQRACLHENDDSLEFLRTVREIDPKLFVVRSHGGYTLLDKVLILNASLDRVRFLLEVFIELDFETSGYKMTEVKFNPLASFCSCWDAEIDRIIRDIEGGERVVTGSSVEDDNLGFSPVIWEKVTLVVKAFYHKSVDDELGDGKTFRLVHALVGIDWCPNKSLRLLVKAFPTSLEACDEDGNLPIHVATRGIFDSSRIEDWEANLRHQKSTIDILLEGNPASARIPNRQGKLPLELAIESGREWKDGGTGSLLEAHPDAAGIRSQSSGKFPLQLAIENGTGCDDEGIEALLKAHPVAATEIDTEAKLPMFMLAAAKHCSVSVIYRLMRASPIAASPAATLNKKKRTKEESGHRPSKRSKQASK